MYEQIGEEKRQALLLSEYLLLSQNTVKQTVYIITMDSAELSAV